MTSFFDTEVRKRLAYSENWPGHLDGNNDKKFLSMVSTDLFPKRVVGIHKSVHNCKLGNITDGLLQRTIRIP